MREAFPELLTLVISLHISYLNSLFSNLLSLSGFSCRTMQTRRCCCPERTWTRWRCCLTPVKLRISPPTTSCPHWTSPSTTMASRMLPCLTSPACTPLRTLPWCASAMATSCWWRWWETACWRWDHHLLFYNPHIQVVWFLCHIQAPALWFHILHPPVAIFGDNILCSLSSPALLAHGHWHCSRFPGSHGLSLDGEELGSGKNPSGGACWEVRVFVPTTNTTNKHTHTHTNMFPLFKHTLLSLSVLLGNVHVREASVPPLSVLMG